MVGPTRKGFLNILVTVQSQLRRTWLPLGLLRTGSDPRQKRVGLLIDLKWSVKAGFSRFFS